MSRKISVYFSEDEEQRIVAQNALDVNLSQSEYLRYKGLGWEIKSDRRMAGVLSIAAQLYCLADSVEESTLRQRLQEIGGALCGLY